MSAAYDTYDYPSYWQGREYEHASEIIALKALLEKIPEINRLIDIGAGYGRLTPNYLYRSKKVVLTDSSAKLLKIARQTFKQESKVKILQTSLENIPDKFKSNSFNVVLLIRVIHHLQDLDQCFKIINRLLVNKGYFIIEFANKNHFKATLRQIFKGNFTFPIDIFPQDKRSRKSRKLKTLPFINYHPDDIEKKLRENGFEILERRSVSNTRSPFLKKYLTLPLLLKFEEFLQIPLARIYFGPSIFLLCRKR